MSEDLTSLLQNNGLYKCFETLKKTALFLCSLLFPWELIFASSPKKLQALDALESTTS